MKLSYMILCMALMAGMTYLIRVLPMVIFRKKIRSVFIPVSYTHLLTYFAINQGLLTYEGEKAQFQLTRK